MNTDSSKAKQKIESRKRKSWNRALNRRQRRERRGIAGRLRTRDERLGTGQVRTRRTEGQLPQRSAKGANLGRSGLELFYLAKAAGCPGQFRLNIVARGETINSRHQRGGNMEINRSVCARACLENYERCCFCGKGQMARRDEVEYPLRIFG